MTNSISSLSVLGIALALTGCVAPIGPVQVTRFHLPETGRLGHGTFAVEPAPAGNPTISPDFSGFAAAVARQLTLLGSTELKPSEADQVVEVRVERQNYKPEHRGGPVSVGFNGSTGSYGSGVGVGLGIDLSGPPSTMVETLLSVTIRDRITHQALWEGRASFVVSARSPLAGTQLGAAKMAEALFKGFPGRSGETIQVQ